MRQRQRRPSAARTASPSTETDLTHEQKSLAGAVLPAIQPAPAEPVSLTIAPSVQTPGQSLSRMAILPPSSSPPSPPNTPVERQTHVWIQPAALGWDAVEPPPRDLGSRIRSAQGGGHSLTPDVQRRLETGLGADLSAVRVHTDSQADRLARSVQAVAFTTGRDIFFRHGSYAPSTASGMQLLAHEATHTVQQAAGPVEGRPMAGGVSVSDPGDRFERAAEATASRVAAGTSVKRRRADDDGTAVARPDEGVSPDEEGNEAADPDILQRSSSSMDHRSGAGLIPRGNAVPNTLGAPIREQTHIRIQPQSLHWPVIQRKKTAQNTSDDLDTLGLGQPDRDALLTLHPTTGNHVTYKHDDLLALGRGLVAGTGQTLVDVVNAVNVTPPLDPPALLDLMQLAPTHTVPDIAVFGQAVITDKLPTARLVPVAQGIGNALTAAETARLMRLHKVYAGDPDLIAIGQAASPIRASDAGIVGRVVKIATGINSKRSALPSADLIIIVRELYAHYDNKGLVTLGVGLVKGLHAVGGQKGAQEMADLARITSPSASLIVSFMRKDEPVKGKLKPVDNFSGHSKDDLGVGELARLRPKIKPRKLTAADIGDLVWRPASGTVSNPDQTRGSADYEAPDIAANERLELVGVNGPYANTVFDTLTPNVVAPDSAKMKRIKGKNIRHTKGDVGVGFQGATWVHAPRAVSLENLETAEDANGGVAGQAAGCADFMGGQVHDPGGVWTSLKAGNAGKGDGVEELSSDSIDTGDYDVATFDTTKGNGWFTWDIGWFYRVANRPGVHQYETIQHREDYTLDTASGKNNHAATITKGGAGPFTKKRLDPTSNY